MAHKITLSDRFMESDYVPAVCVFSGRTDEIKAKKMGFVYYPPSAQAGFLIGGALLMSIMSKRFSIDIPAAPKERFKWGLKRNAWVLLLLGLPALGCLVTLPFSGNGSRGGDVIAAGIGIGFVLGLVATLVAGIWAWLTQTGFKATDEGEIEVRFPNRLKEVYEVYRQATKEYEAERRRRRGLRGGGRGEAGEQEDEEDWADKGDGQKWDEGEKK